MSAYIVSPETIRALVAAGLEYGKRPGNGELRWLWPRYPALEGGSHRAGSPWGPMAVAIAHETRQELTWETAEAVFAMLLDENLKSVGYRYDEPARGDGLPGLIDGCAYEWSDPRATWDPDALKLLKVLSCYEYQSCEDPGWRDSEAFAFCDALRHALISMLPGYDAAPWGCDDLAECGDVSPGRISITDMIRDAGRRVG